MSTIDVYDTDPKDMRFAVEELGEVCSIRHSRGNYSTVIRLTVDEAQVLREKLATWLFREEA